VRTNLDTLTLLTSIASRGLAVLYGLLSLLHFNKVENLNIWIISGYVATVATLANIIVQPTPFLDADEIHIGIGGKKFNKRVFLGVVSAFAVQAFLAFVTIISNALEASPSFIFVIFFLQSLQFPFIFRILFRNESNYFIHSRIHLLRAALIGNVLSLITILGYYFFKIEIDFTIETYLVFIALQVICLAIQDFLYTREVKAERKLDQEYSNTKVNHLPHVKKRFLPGLRMYIYVPCFASFWMFIEDPLNPEITAVFLGLNLVTLLTYLGLPNEKLEYGVDTKVKRKRSVIRIIRRSALLYLLVLFGLLCLLFLSQRMEIASLIINSQNIKSMAIFSFVGLFLLPIVLLSNNEIKNRKPKIDILDITVIALAISFSFFLFLAKLSASECIIYSYLCSFLVWYTLTLGNLWKKVSFGTNR